MASTVKLKAAISVKAATNLESSFLNKILKSLDLNSSNRNSGASGTLVFFVRTAV